MRYLPRSDVETVKSELLRLYEKRLIVDELIHNLERLARYESTSAADNADPGKVANIYSFAAQP